MHIAKIFYAILFPLSNDIFFTYFKAESPNLLLMMTQTPAFINLG